MDWQEYYQLNRQKYIERSKIARKNHRQAAAELKNGPCLDCESSFPFWAMDFDHIQDKSFDISAMVSGGRPIEIIKLETQKCDLICVLCHRLRTQQRGHTGTRKPKPQNVEKECPCPQHGLNYVTGCKECGNARTRRAYFRHRADRAPRNHAPYREHLTNSLKRNPCRDCNRRFEPVQMDFDHVRGEKLAHPNRLIADNAKNLMEELAKCELVCAVCHRFRTRNRAGKAIPLDLEFMKTWISNS